MSKVPYTWGFFCCFFFLVVMTGATCDASSVESSDTLCPKAFDGSTLPGTNEWVSKNDGDAAWISITLTRMWFITEIGLYQRCSNFDQATSALIELDVGRTVNIVSGH